MFKFLSKSTRSKKHQVNEVNKTRQNKLLKFIRKKLKKQSRKDQKHPDEYEKFQVSACSTSYIEAISQAKTDRMENDCKFKSLQHQSEQIKSNMLNGIAECIMSRISSSILEKQIPETKKTNNQNFNPLDIVKLTKHIPEMRDDFTSKLKFVEEAEMTFDQYEDLIRRDATTEYIFVKQLTRKLLPRFYNILNNKRIRDYKTFREQLICEMQWKDIARIHEKELYNFKPFINEDPHETASRMKQTINIYLRSLEIVGHTPEEIKQARERHEKILFENVPSELKKDLKMHAKHIKLQTYDDLLAFLHDMSGTTSTESFPIYSIGLTEIDKNTPLEIHKEITEIEKKINKIIQMMDTKGTTQNSNTRQWPDERNLQRTSRREDNYQYKNKRNDPNNSYDNRSRNEKNFIDESQDFRHNRNYNNYQNQNHRCRPKYQSANYKNVLSETRNPRNNYQKKHNNGRQARPRIWHENNGQNQHQSYRYDGKHKDQPPDSRDEVQHNHSQNLRNTPCEPIIAQNDYHHDYSNKDETNRRNWHEITENQQHFTCESGGNLSRSSSGYLSFDDTIQDKQVTPCYQSSAINDYNKEKLKNLMIIQNSPFKKLQNIDSNRKFNRNMSILADASKNEKENFFNSKTHDRDKIKAKHNIGLLHKNSTNKILRSNKNSNTTRIFLCNQIKSQINKTNHHKNNYAKKLDENIQTQVDVQRSHTNKRYKEVTTLTGIENSYTQETHEENRILNDTDIISTKCNENNQHGIQI